MKKLTRYETVKVLVDDDIDTIYSKQATDYIYNILKSGFKGYNNYTKEELYQEYIERFNEGIEIIKEK